MNNKIVYYLDSEEAKYISQELCHMGGIFSDTEFRELRRSDLLRVSIRDLASIFHPDQSTFPEYCALIWGSGKDHDISLIMSPQTDFMKSVDDAHTDYTDGVSTAITGVNECVHNSILLHNYQHAKVVEVRGNLREDMKMVECGPKKEKKLYLQHPRASLFGGKKAECPIHKSIDMDVVPSFPARYDWQNNPGTGMVLEELNADLERVCTVNRVTRFDIGGLHFPKPEELEHYIGGKINPKENAQALSFAVLCYKTLLETYLRNIPST